MPAQCSVLTTSLRTKRVNTQLATGLLSPTNKSKREGEIRKEYCRLFRVSQLTRKRVCRRSSLDDALPECTRVARPQPFAAMVSTQIDRSAGDTSVCRCE